MGSIGLSLYKEGIEEGIFSSLKNLMASMNITISAAMDLLRIPQADRPQLEAMLKAAQ